MIENKALLVRITVDGGAVSYSGYYAMDDSTFKDLAAIYEDPFYEGGNLIAIAT